MLGLVPATEGSITGKALCAPNVAPGRGGGWGSAKTSSKRWAAFIVIIFVQNSGPSSLLGEHRTCQSPSSSHYI